jgi:hypothetical protein
MERQWQAGPARPQQPLVPGPSALQHANSPATRESGVKLGYREAWSTPVKQHLIVIFDTKMLSMYANAAAGR